MEQLGLTIGAAIMLSLVTFLNKRGNGEAFSIIKFGRTICVGIVIGIVAWQSGSTVTPETWGASLAGSTGAIAVVDQIINFVIKQVTKK